MLYNNVLHSALKLCVPIVYSPKINAIVLIVRFQQSIYIYVRYVNIYICRVTINGEKRLGGATKQERGKLGLLNARERVFCGEALFDLMKSV